MYIFILILLLPLNLIFHELGHIGFYLFNKINICAFVYYKNVFVRFDNKWRRIYANNNEKAYVIPDMYSEYKLEKYERIIAGSILAGPIVTIILLILFSAAFIILCYNNELNTLGKLLLLLNVAINLSVLHGCIKGTEESIGDIAIYFKGKKNRKFLVPYIMDYVVLNGGTNIDISCILTYDFCKLDIKEKIDWAYDVVTLFLLGNINDVPKKVTMFIYSYYNSSDNDDTIRERFKQYLEFIGMKTCEERKVSGDSSNEGVFEKIIEIKGINEKIIERIGERNGQNTRGC